MKLKSLSLIAALSCALLLSQSGCGTQTQSTPSPNKGNSGNTQATAPNSSDSSSGNSNGTSQTPSTSDASGTSAGSGNSTSAGTTGSTQTGSADQSEKTTLPKDWEMASKLYAVQGTIVSLDQKDGTLHAIKIKVIKNIKGASSAMDSPNEPFALDSTAEIQFDEPMSEKGSLDLKVGNEVVINTGQYSFLPKVDKTVWASKFVWVSVKKDGKFYDDKGQVLPYK